MESQDFAQNGTAESDSTAFLYKSLRRLYVYAQIFGCASFSYTPETGVHVKAINTFSLVIFTVFFTTIAYSNIILELTIDVKGYQAILFYFGLRTMLCFTLLLLWALTCFLFLYKKQIAHLMEEIIALDGEMREMDMISEHINYLLEYELIFCGLLASASLACALFYGYVSFYVDGEFLTKVLCFFTFGGILGIHLFHASVITIFYVTIQIKFSLLNDYFRLVFIPSPTMVSPPQKSSIELQKLVFKIARIHDKLCQLYFKTNRYSSITLIIVPLNILLTTLFSLETVFVGLIERNFNLQLLGFVYIYYTFHMYLVIIAQLHAIVNSGAEGRFTGVLVHQALVHTIDADLMQKLELFSMQILHSNLKCALSIMDYDWKLMFSFISTTLSYSVILIQYQFFLSSANIKN